MDVYLLYIDLVLCGVFSKKETAIKLLNKKKEEAKPFYAEDNWIDTHILKQD